MGELQGEKTTKTQSPNTPNLTLSQQKMKEKTFLSVYGALSLFSLSANALNLQHLSHFVGTSLLSPCCSKHKGIIPLYRKTIVCLEGSRMFHQHQEDSFFLEDSGMFHQHQEDSFFLKNEAIVDLCRTREKVPEDSAYQIQGIPQNDQVIDIARRQ